VAAVISITGTPARLVGDHLTPRTAIPKEDPQDG